MGLWNYSQNRRAVPFALVTIPVNHQKLVFEREERVHNKVYLSTWGRTKLLISTFCPGEKNTNKQTNKKSFELTFVTLIAIQNIFSPVHAWKSCSVSLHRPRVSHIILLVSEVIETLTLNTYCIPDWSPTTLRLREAMISFLSEIKQLFKYKVGLLVTFLIWCLMCYLKR